MKQGLFTIQQRDDTRWHVCETGLARSLASFGLKEDAIEYARELAGWQATYEGAGGNELGENAASGVAARIGVHA